MRKLALAVSTSLLLGCPPPGGEDGGSGGGGGGMLAVTISSPTGTAYTNGRLQLTLTVTGGPERVALLSDGAEVSTAAAPYTGASLDTAGLTEGMHQVTARATKGTEVVSSAALTVVVDRTPPTVMSKWPETGAWLAENVGAEFSEPLLATSAGGSVLTLTLGGAMLPTAAPMLSADGRTLTVLLSQPLTQLGTVTAALATTLTDRAGNALAPTSWTFGVERWAKTPSLVATGGAGYFARVAVRGDCVSFVTFSERRYMGTMADPTADKVRVVRVERGTQTPIGAFALSAATGGSAFPDVAVDTMGRVVVAYQDETMNGSAIHVQRWESGTWTELGAMVGTGRWPRVAIDSSGNPVVAWSDDGGPMRMGPRAIHVSKWSGTAWAAAAADLMTLGVNGAGDPSGPSLVLGTGGAPIVAYVELGTSSSGNAASLQARVAQANGMQGWTQVGASLNVKQTGNAQWVSLASQGGKLVVAWEEDDGYLPNVHVAESTGAAWTRLGRPLDVDVTKTARWPAIAVDSMGAPIVTWMEDVGWGRVSMPVARYAAGAWSFVGGEEVVGGSPLLFPGNVVVHDDAPVVAYHQFETGDFKTSSVGLRQYNGKGVPRPFGIAARPAASMCQVIGSGATGIPAATLSATQCFTLGQFPPTAAADLIPFDLVSPLWSDGALKRRWVRLPAGGTMTYADTGAWGFPIGTMVVKEFSYNADPNDRASRRPVETRFLVKRADAGWEGYSYQWDDTFVDAQLLPGAGVTRKTWPQVGGGAGHTQIYPSRTDCTRCHASAAGNILGLQAGQLNRSFDYGGVYDNELRVLEHIGVFANGTSTAAAPRFAQPFDTTEPMDKRVRAYLAANCAQCHRPGGERSTRDFRYEASWAETSICDGGGPFGPEINPGDAGTSLLPQKMKGTGPAARMPPIATDVVDSQAVSIVEEWIDGLTACPQ